MSASESMLEAHVRFEVDRLNQELDQTVELEVQALFDWLAGVTLDDIATTEQVVSAAWVWIDAISESDLQPHLTQALVQLKGALADSPATVGDVLSRDDLVRWATTLADMRQARAELLERLTSSKAYSRLVAHVVYHGIKNYLLTENVLARRIPGASSLVRLGQRGLGAAAPGLEQNVDRQLIAFVDASIADTVRESRRFLDTMLDSDTVETMARDAWAAGADKPLAAGADLLSDEELEVVTDLVWSQWQSLRRTDALHRLLAELVEGFLQTHGSRPIADLLADVGVTPDVVTRAVSPLARSSVDRALESGYAEQRIRARLAAFYDSYQA